jgi:Mn2+/Fe2+ NRAMP family transporter
MTMLAASNPKVMGRLTLPPLLKFGGWLATAVMILVSAMFLLS